MALHNDYQNPRRIAVERAAERTRLEHQREAVLKYVQLLGKLTTARHAYSTAKALREFDGDEPVKLTARDLTAAGRDLSAFLSDLDLPTDLGR